MSFWEKEGGAGRKNQLMEKRKVSLLRLKHCAREALCVSFRSDSSEKKSGTISKVTLQRASTYRSSRRLRGDEFSKSQTQGEREKISRTERRSGLYYES